MHLKDKANDASISQASACILSTEVPLAKASRVAEPQVKGQKYTFPSPGGTSKSYDQALCGQWHNSLLGKAKERRWVGIELVSCGFGDCWHSLAGGRVTWTFKTSLFKSLCSFSCVLLLCTCVQSPLDAVSWEYFWGHLRPTQIIQIISPHFKIFNHSWKALTG